jgi:hypothetical protein
MSRHALLGLSDLSDWHSFSSDDFADFSDYEKMATENTATSNNDQSTENMIPSSDGPVMTSPITGTAAEKQMKRRRKSAKKQKATIHQKQQDARDKSAQQLRQAVEDVLQFLEDRDIHFGELVKFVFNPENGLGNVRWHQFFAHAGDASQILEWWTSSANGRPGRDEVKDWAIDYVGKLVAKEAEAVTKSKILQTKEKTIDQEFVTSFNLS